MKMKIENNLMEVAMFEGNERGEIFNFKGVPGQHPKDTAMGWGARYTKAIFIPININTYSGGIPSGYELVVRDAVNGDEYVLYGFDEIGMDFGIKKPVYGFAHSFGPGAEIEFDENPKAYQAWLDKVLANSPLNA